MVDLRETLVSTEQSMSDKFLPSDLERRIRDVDARFHRIASSLRRFELQALAPEDLEITEEDILGGMGANAESLLFLGFYSQQGIETAFERYGIREILQERGFNDVHIAVELSDPFVHQLHMWEGPKDHPDARISELRVRRLAELEEESFPKDERGGRDFLLVDWLLLQNPRADFTDTRPRLPGQRFPGIGIGPEVMEMLQIMAERLDLAGIVTHPMYLHNAALYGLRCRFVTPETEGRFRALLRDLHGHGLSEASWAVELGAVTCVESGETLTWQGREQLFALDRRVAKHFERTSYVRARDAAYRRCHFALDRERLAEGLAEVARGDTPSR